MVNDVTETNRVAKLKFDKPEVKIPGPIMFHQLAGHFRLGLYVSRACLSAVFVFVTLGFASADMT